MQVDSIDLHWNFRLHDQDDPLAFTLLGRNDFAVLNPRASHVAFSTAPPSTGDRSTSAEIAVRASSDAPALLPNVASLNG